MNLSWTFGRRYDHDQKRGENIKRDTHGTPQGRNRSATTRDRHKQEGGTGFGSDPTHLGHSLVWFHLDVRNVAINHERNQIDDQIGVLAQRRESGVTQTLESRVMGRMYASHRVDHLFAYFDRRWKWLGIATEDVAKVNWCATRWVHRQRSDCVIRCLTIQPTDHGRSDHQERAADCPSDDHRLRANT